GIDDVGQRRSKRFTTLAFGCAVIAPERAHCRVIRYISHGSRRKAVDVDQLGTAKAFAIVKTQSDLDRTALRSSISVRQLLPAASQAGIAIAAIPVGVKTRANGALGVPDPDRKIVRLTGFHRHRLTKVGFTLIVTFDEHGSSRLTLMANGGGSRNFDTCVDRRPALRLLSIPAFEVGIVECGTG